MIPGYVLIKKTKFFAKQPGLELSLGYFIIIVLYALLATADYVLRLSPLLTRWICWIIIVGTLLEFFRARYYKDLWKLRFPLCCWLAASLLAIAFLGLPFSQKYTYTPDPKPLPNTNYNVLNVKVLNIAQTQANDNYIPYRQAQFFINRLDPIKSPFLTEWGVGFFERTPLMGAVTANYFNLFHDKVPVNLLWSSTAQDPGHTYLQFQILASVLNMLFVVPAFFLLERLFGKKTAIIACLFFATSQYYLYDAVFTWPKSLVAFFVLLTWLLLLERKQSYVILAGIISGIAYLTHDLAVLYIGATIVFLLYQKRYRDTLIYLVWPILFALPWLYAADIYYKQPSSFIYYPLSLGGIPQSNQGKQIIHQFLHTPLLTLIRIRLENIVYLLSPYQLFSSEGFGRLWTYGLYSVPGAVGAGLTIPIYLACLKYWRKTGILILILVPVLLESLIIGWPKGLGALHFAEALVVLATGLAIYYLLSLKRKYWILLAYAVSSLQLVFLITFSYHFHVHEWLQEPKDIAIVFYILALPVGSGWLIYRTINQPDPSRLSPTNQPYAPD